MLLPLYKVIVYSHWLRENQINNVDWLGIQIQLLEFGRLVLAHVDADIVANVRTKQNLANALK